MAAAIRLSLIWLVVMTFVAGCSSAGPSAPTSSQSDSRPTTSSGSKRVVAGILGNPYTLSQAINAAGTGSIRGVSEAEKLYHMGLVIRDADGRFQPALAEAVPTIENGNWRVLADGRMETTWRIKPNARWHDGTPFTAADLVFTTQVGQDKDVAMSAYPGYKQFDGIEAVDDRTVTVRWKAPYIEADSMFSHEFALPMPKHLLEQPYLADKANFVNQPFWTTDYVGAGPFKMHEFVRDSHMMLDAFDGYALGRPKLDQIEIRFLQDPNVMIANVLSNEVELTIGRGFNLEQVLQVSTMWQNGRMETSPSNWLADYPQSVNPSPAALGDARFRRALLYAIDRQAMSDALQAGQAQIAHMWLEYGDPNWSVIEPKIVKYSYDPKKATSLFEEMGLTRGSDGIYRDASGQRMVVESRTNAGDDLKEKMVLSGADYWRQVGIDVDTVIVPRQLASDREYRANFPGFDLVRQPFEPERFLSSEAALPENRYNGKNRTRYQNPELDGYIERYLTTVPMKERVDALTQVMRLISDQLPALGIFYAPEPKLISNRLVDVHAAHAAAADETWNAHLWDVR